MRYTTLLQLINFSAAFRIKDSANSQQILTSRQSGLSPPITSIADIETQNLKYTIEGDELYQGDMILTREQKERFESPVKMRKAIDEEKYRWPGAVVQYTISPGSIFNRKAILRGMNHWTQNTCVTFEEVQSTYEAPHLIFKKLDGCYSSVGRNYKTNGQTISIGSQCTDMGTVVHEIGHALGFHHEHSRPDRDQHVVILDHNIDEDREYNFKVENNLDNYQIPYDTESIMHYGPTAFSISKDKNTIVTKDPFKIFSIGQRNKLSFADLKLANLMYNCASYCGPNKCLNSAYVDKNCSCKCPPGYSGDLCQNIVDVPPALTCGSFINSPTSIESPNYPNPYPKNTKCVWLIKAPIDRRVRANFLDFEISGRWGEQNWCSHDFLELRSSDEYEGEKYCGTELNQTSIISRGYTMVLTFSAGSSISPGFYANITFV